MLVSDVVGYHMRPSRDVDQETRLSISTVWGEPWPQTDGAQGENAALAAAVPDYCGGADPVLPRRYASQ